MRMVRYKVVSDRVQENQQMIRAVFDTLKSQQPEGLRYTSFLHADGATFTHLVAYEREENGSILTTLPAFQTFVKDIRQRCEEPPLTTELTQIGTYGFYG